MHCMVHKVKNIKSGSPSKSLCLSEASQLVEEIIQHHPCLKFITVSYTIYLLGRGGFHGIANYVKADACKASPL